MKASVCKSSLLHGGKIAMVHSLKYDYYKFPGGGIENGETPEEAAEVNVPHFYVNKEDFLRLLPDFEIVTIRHVDDCYHNGHFGKGCHYHISATLKKNRLCKNRHSKLVIQI